MDNDNFSPLKIRGSQILGLKKLAVNAIEAEGIKLGEASSSIGEPPNKISWVEKSTGKIQEYIYGSHTGVGSWLYLVANRTAEGEPEAPQRSVGVVMLDAHAQGILKNAWLKVEAIKEGIASVLVSGGGGQENERTIIDENQRSNFLQLFTEKEIGLNNKRFSPAKRFALSGAVSSTGAILAGSNFTVTHLGTGLYRITLASNLSSVGSLYVEVNGPFTQIHKATGPSVNQWEIQINGFQGLGGGTITLQAADENFSFYVMQH